VFQIVTTDTIVHLFRNKGGEGNMLSGSALVIVYRSDVPACFLFVVVVAAAVRTHGQ
jgi:hypothetical protein